MILTNSGIRVLQACDRCRMKKIKCDGGTPCNKCTQVGFECTTLDKLLRRAFPKGYTVNLEKRVKELEEEVAALRGRGATPGETGTATLNNTVINNPIDQIFNLDRRGIIIGNDNLNFESQFNHLLINLNLPFLKITNLHNFLLQDPDLYLYHKTYTKNNQYHNRDLELVYNPVTVKLGPELHPLPTDVYDLFIKLINNFKTLFASKKELDHAVTQFFLHYNTFIPIFDWSSFMKLYDAFHTMYPFMFTYDDATINGFNLLTYDYHVVNEYMGVVIQIYAMIAISDPTLNMNLLLNHAHPSYAFSHSSDSVVKLLYDFLPYMNVFYVLVDQLRTLLLFFYYLLLTNNKEKALLILALVNSYIGVLGINLNLRNLFFNDMQLPLAERRDRVKIFWGFKVLLKCFNLKFGFKPLINTTVINPVTIERYFKLTPEKLSTLLDPQPNEPHDALFDSLLRPSVEFLNLMNIIIPSSFSPNYYQYLKHDKHQEHKKPHNLDWILNDDDGDGNDGNLNYNYTQFVAIDSNLSAWRYALKEKTIDPLPLHSHMGLPILATPAPLPLYHRAADENQLSDEGMLHFASAGLPDVHTAASLIKIQLNFHYLLIRLLNYLNFVIDRELTQNYYVKIANIAREVLMYFIVVFDHVGQAHEHNPASTGYDNGLFSRQDVDEDGFVINDFSVKRRKSSASSNPHHAARKHVLPSPFNAMLNGLSLTIINFKKSIVLQMLYLLICTLKIAKKGGTMSPDTVRVLNRSISLFIRIFINYRPNANKYMKTKKVKEDDLFKRIISDELKDEILNTKQDDSDDEYENEIDWDDEEMDEDLKYLKILKYVKYKTNLIYERNLQSHMTGQLTGHLTTTMAHPPSAQVQHHLMDQMDPHNDVLPPHVPHPHVQLPPIQMLLHGPVPKMHLEGLFLEPDNKRAASELVNLKQGRYD